MNYITLKGIEFPEGEELSWTDKVTINSLIGVVGQDVIKINGYLNYDNVRIMKVDKTYMLMRIE